MNKNIKLLLLDLDGLFYHSCRDTIEESIQVFNDKLQNCLDATGCTHWAAFMGKGKTFRKKLTATYKSNRKPSPLKYLSVLKEWSAVEYGVNLCTDYEADDAVAYFYNKDIYYGESALAILFEEGVKYTFTTNSDELVGDYIKVDKVIASPDKDILQSIPGIHFNYTYRLEDKSNPDSVIKGWWVTTNEEEAAQFPLYQLIVGKLLLTLNPSNCWKLQ